jgi:predicted ATPase
MITKLRLEYFKCFEKVHLPFAPLTLLSGFNSSGKSTVLQSLVLLHQTIIENEWSNSLILNGTDITLGSFGDIVDKVKGRFDFSIGLDTEEYECIWKMKDENKDELSASLEEIEIKDNKSVNGDKWSRKEHLNDNYRNIEEQSIFRLFPKTLIDKFSEASKHFSDILFNLSYVSSERIGPRETYELSSKQRHRNVGSKGERTPWFLYEFGESRYVADQLQIKGHPPQLKKQTVAWLNKFFPNSDLKIELIKGTNLVTLGISSGTKTYHRPQNVGYGITNVLPILVSCLGSTHGDVILIDTPELHLHPEGQSLMGEFLSLVASSGVQVIVETHSDHILNGIRKTVKTTKLNATDLSFLFFKQRSEDDKESQIIHIEIDKQGNLSEWPKGFFDQFDEDIATLSGLRV